MEEVQGVWLENKQKLACSKGVVLCMVESGRCDPAFPKHGWNMNHYKCQISCEGTSWTDMRSGLIKVELLELTVKS